MIEKERLVNSLWWLYGRGNLAFVEKVNSREGYDTSFIDIDLGSNDLNTTGPLKYRIKIVGELPCEIESGKFVSISRNQETGEIKISLAITSLLDLDEENRGQLSMVFPCADHESLYKYDTKKLKRD